MRIENFEATGLERFASWLDRDGFAAPGMKTMRQALKSVNISFVLEGIDRVQSTLLCELNDSYVQQSQRYVALERDAYLLPELDAPDFERAVELTERAFSLYDEMSRLKEGEFKGRPKTEHYLYGIPIEDARYILPLSCKTNLCVTLSGDKLPEFFRLLHDRRYVRIFSGIENALAQLLPRKLVEVLRGEKDEAQDDALLQEFYHDYFAALDEKENLVLLEHFADLDLRVALGALTSTSKQTAAATREKWGEEASFKAKSLVKRVLGYGHDSIAEQARTTFGMMCSMVTYHQQLRHRLSRNQREELTALLEARNRQPKVPASVAASAFAADFCRLAEEFKEFRSRIAAKYGADKAFAFLLNCDQIKLIVSANARADVSMLAERTCMNAQWEIRELAIKKLRLLRTLSDVLYEKALPSCVSGACREGALSCGRANEVRREFGAE